MQRITIFNCVIHNVWQRGVKGVRVPAENREAMRPKDCRIQYCLFYKGTFIWGFEGTRDPNSIRSNTFSIEWPPRSGRMKEFPEIDRVEFVPIAVAGRS